MPDEAYERARADILAANRDVRELDLSDRNLTALPPEISRLTALQRLYLSNNQLTALPPEISRLTALQDLYLSSNQLTALPSEIPRLTALQTLFLRNNQLTALPPEIAHLTALEDLDLGNNQLTALPPELGTLASLAWAAHAHTQPITKGLFIGGNPLPDPYPALIAPGQPAATINVLAYLRGERVAALDDPPPPEDAPPTIPPPRPAAIRVTLANNRLTLAPTPSPADIDAATIHAAIIALKTSMADLLEDAATDTSNFDRRALPWIRRALDRMPNQDMPAHALFQLAHLHEALAKYAKTVADEWPEFLVAQFGVVLINLDRLIAHFPAWQTFVPQRDATKLTPEQARAVPDIARAMIADLRNEDSREFVEENIPQALDQLTELSAMLGDDALDQLAPDILESLNTVLKWIVAIAMGTGRAAGGKALLRRITTEFGKPIRRDTIKLAGDLGAAVMPGIRRWARKFLTTGKFSAGFGTPTAILGPTLAKAFPESLGWIEPFLAILSRLPHPF